MSSPSETLRATVSGAVDRLVVVLGDQLDRNSPVFDDFDKHRDAVVMMEVAEEATHVPSHKQRTVLFLSAMRHFALDLIDVGYRVRYVKLDATRNTGTLTGELARAVSVLTPSQLALVVPGEHRVLRAIRSWAEGEGVALSILSDPHFLTDRETFQSWADGRKELVMEYFYREQRKRLDVLMTKGGKPEGGAWNYDKKNRESFDAAPRPPAPKRFAPDAVTKEVLAVVESHYPRAYGEVTSFGWAVTRRQAKRALRDFVSNRLGRFGPVQDAMWVDEPFLYHSLLSPYLNLKLLDPREVVEAAIEAYEAGDAPLQSVEGFVRQIIGWREFIRGVYWMEGSSYGERNTLEQHGELPEFYWHGETEMRCLAESLGQVVTHAYGHHIQRLMVTGNFALIAGVHPRAVSDWYLAMYVDAVDWVTLPNTLGMVMHADGGVVGTKPYAASGRYIQRMSNYCASCRFDPGKRTGKDACPFTTFYWDFLIRNQRRFAKNRRMAMMMKHVERMDTAERGAIGRHAEARRDELGIGSVAG